MGKVVNKIKYTFILVAFFSLTINATSLDNNKLKFVVLGHTYSTITSDSLRNLYFNKINSEKPDYVFILGDSEINNPKIFNYYNTSIKSKVFFAPGNHEIHNPASKEKYLSIVKYLNKTIIDEQCNFIVLNSLTSVDEINEYLATAFNKINPKNPVIVLTHNRIWDDNLLSKSKYQHDKSFLFNEIDVKYRNRIDYIFAGNSSAQYFVKVSDQLIINSNIVYWTDVIDNTTCYSIGMKYQVNYSTVVLNDKKLSIFPVIPFKTNVKDNFPKNFKSQNSIISLLKNTTMWVSFLIGIICTLIIFKFIKK